MFNNRKDHTSDFGGMAVKLLLLIITVSLLFGCGGQTLVGIIYTNVRLPLTRNLDNTPMPDKEPPSSKVLEIKEPLTGAGLYAQIDANAIGAIAKNNGMETLYFADQQIFSVLGVWGSNKTILYGE